MTTSPVELSQDAPGLFLVRAQVREDLRGAFDKWYETEHLPDASRLLGATASRRFWSATDPSVHIALYEFDRLGTLTAKVPGSPELQWLLDEFDRHWPDGVHRTREILGSPTV